jgi:hypothetical protein
LGKEVYDQREQKQEDRQAKLANDFLAAYRKHLSQRMSKKPLQQS